MGWKAAGTVRGSVTFRDNDIDLVRPDDPDSYGELLAEVNEQVVASHAAVKALLDSGALGGQGNAFDVKLVGTATEAHAEIGEVVTITVESIEPVGETEAAEAKTTKSAAKK